MITKEMAEKMDNELEQAITDGINGKKSKSTKQLLDLYNSLE